MLFVILDAMNKNHISSLLRSHLPFTPTNCQSVLIEGISDFIIGWEEDSILLIKGFAGTGKTTIINLISKTVRMLKKEVILLAPTGRAAKVITGYTSLPAYTIHKKIYRQRSSSDGMGKFVLDRNMSRNTWFIVDEASMISNESNDATVFGSGKLLDDLLTFVYSGLGCRLIIVGDTAQLPPVGFVISPALDPKELEKQGFNVKEFILTEVVRQASGSGILSCATEIRRLIEQGNTSKYLPLHLKGFTDIFPITGGDLIETISTCYDRYGIEDTIVVTRSNKRANLYNKGIRGSILYRENEIERGDLLMVVKNNYHWMDPGGKIGFIANGDIVKVVSIYGYETLYGFRFANVSLRFVDYDDEEIDCKIFLDTLEIETASFSVEQSRSLFYAVSEDYMDISNKRNRWEKIRKNPYFNALQVKYAYAMTCHKAQGGQWKTVFIDHGYLENAMVDQNFYRWLYTAFTRPVERLYLVNFAKDFFAEK